MYELRNCLHIQMGCSRRPQEDKYFFPPTLMLTKSLQIFTMLNLSKASEGRGGQYMKVIV